MYKVDSGILFCEIETRESGDEFAEWIPARAGIELDVITAFYEIENSLTKIITCDGDIYCIHIPFDKFSDILIKHRNSFVRVNN